MMALVYTPPLPRAASLVLLAVLVCAGCGSGSSADTNETVSGAVATAGVVHPGGGAYSYTVPDGWRSLARIRVGNAADGARGRSAIVRGSGLIYVFATARGTKTPRAFGDQYQKGLQQLGMSSTALAAANVNGHPQLIYDVSDVPIAGGGSGDARKVLVFSPDAIVVVSCQWDRDADQTPTLQACDSVRNSLAVPAA